MAKKKDLQAPEPVSLGPSGNASELTGRYFTDKELKDKAARWAAEIKRGQDRTRRGSDTIPPDLEEAKALAGGIFLPADGAIFAAELEKAVQ